VCKFPQILCLSLENNIKPTILFLTEELGIALHDVGKIVQQNPQLLGLNVATNLRRKVQYLVGELGVPQEQLARIVTAFPTLLSLSDETNLRPKVSFLTQEAGFAIHDIVKAPHLLAYSLEQRIKPRCALMKKAGLRMALASLLSPSDSVFYARFSAAL
jgi:mTERF domain-containing protein